MKILRLIIFVILFVVGITSFAQAVGNNDIEYAKNYLIILVHCHPRFQTLPKSSTTVVPLG